MVEVAVEIESNNSRICKKDRRSARASHRILEAYSGGEMPKEVQSPK